MAPPLVSTSAATALVTLASAVVTLASLFIRRSRRIPSVPSRPATRLVEAVAAALPDSVLLPGDGAAFTRATTAYWAAQEGEAVPGCVLRPRDALELGSAVEILRLEHARQRQEGSTAREVGLFAVRSGGHSAVPGAASIKDGVLIDLSLLCEVTPSDDGTSVTFGAGARWKDVYRILDNMGIGVAGGRNSDVGVGGLTLGGGISFFSPRFGLVCSNILSYEAVLASGSVVVASASERPDLWRALKGGANNFGIVTRFTARSFPSAKIWSGFLYMPPSQADKVLAGFHEYVDRTSSDDLGTAYDPDAAGPIACFTYVQQLGIQVISVNIVHTRPAENEKKWPRSWRTSAFASIWRFWSTCKVRTMTSAGEEMSSLNPPGKRQVLGTTTIKNKPAALAATHDAYRAGIDAMRKIRGGSWTLVLQPLLPQWVRKGDGNSLGLDEGPSEPLVMVSFTVNWSDARDDAHARGTTRRAIEMIERIATETGSTHRYRYLNYCDEWQRPFEGYGEENWRFLKKVSRKYDPEGLFQEACVGGFKLDVKDEGS